MKVKIYAEAVSSDGIEQDLIAEFDMNDIKCIEKQYDTLFVYHKNRKVNAYNDNTISLEFVNN